MATIEGAPDLASLAELKAFLRIEHDADDALLAAMLRSAAATVEVHIGRVLVRREVAERAVPAGGRLVLRAQPVVSVVALAREEPDGSETGLAPEAFRLDVDREGRGWLWLRSASGQPHRVRYLAGVAGDWNGVPEPVRMAVLRAAAHLYTHRDAPEDAGLPAAVRQLLAPWRALRLC